MHLIIPAAGRGRRLYPLTRGTPKSLLDLGDGSTLLQRQMDLAVASQCISRITIITGFLHEQIEHFAAGYAGRVRIDTVHNPYFDHSNAFLSLWCAHHAMQDEDFFISNGDNLYRNPVYDEMLANSMEGISMAVSHKSQYDDDDMKVRAQHNRLIEVGKRVAPEEADADSVGLVCVRGATARAAFRETMIRGSKQPAFFNAFWQESLNELVRSGVPVSLWAMAHEDWVEVDFHPDVESLRKAVLDKVF